jgi:hypothetical protein
MEGQKHQKDHFSAESIFLPSRNAGLKKVEQFRIIRNISGKPALSRKNFGLFFWERDRPGRCAGRLASHFQSQVRARSCPSSSPCQSDPVKPMLRVKLAVKSCANPLQ